FVTAFGLRASRDGDEIELRATGSDHRWARILPSGAKSLAYLSFNCYDTDFPIILNQLKACGATRSKSEEHVDGDGFWFHDPDGNLLQLRVGPKTSPARKGVATMAVTAPGERGVLGRAHRPRTTPTRLSHVLMFTPDLDRALRFYGEGLGLRLSDRSRDIVAFMHARHGCDHHLVAFVRNAFKGWHHSAWDVPGIEQIGCGAEQMREAGFGEGWGLARHTLGSNYFHYVRDPWGSFWEYSADIDYVPAGSVWPGGDYPPEDALYMWGPAMPHYFIENTEHTGM
ncbi:MAG TPA: VOC family protein, partial [Burkholderiaceae bacterium]|nr:VOC family protein [Burkholderiaceae bacterium]